jgi:hypothetical protein
MDKEKPGLVLAIGMKPKKEDKYMADDDGDESESMNMDEKKAEAAKLALKAIESRDATKFQKALEAFVYACGDSESADTDEPKSEE